MNEECTNHQVPGEESQRPWKKISGWSFGIVTVGEAVDSPRTRATSWRLAKIAANAVCILWKIIIEVSGPFSSSKCNVNSLARKISVPL